jgi:hypothetical protein
MEGRQIYRGAVGILALLAGLLGLAALFFFPVPPENKDPLMLALGLVLAWGGTVVGYEFGDSASGRKAAEDARSDQRRSPDAF